uniref:Vacuolar protein sorting-associated protein 22-like protein 1 n=1 Tax=Noccaea caerulescens TaxID=107243 RepID=A0A1J3EYD0_NOCCA
MLTRSHNGGLISLQELCSHLRQRRKNDREAVTEDDCRRAISKLKVLGNEFEVITVGKKKLIRSVPTELNKDLNKDHNQILELAQGQGFVTVEEVQRRHSWTSGRVIC